MNKEQFVITDGLLNNNKFICKMENDKITIQRESINRDNFYGLFKSLFKVHVVAHDIIYSSTYLTHEITYDINTKEIVLIQLKNSLPIPSTERVRISDDDVLSLYSFSPDSNEILIVFNKIK